MHAILDIGTLASVRDVLIMRTDYGRILFARILKSLVSGTDI